MPDDIIISELSNAPQIDDSAVFPLTQDNAGSPATFKGSMSQIAGKIGEGTTFANLHTTSKTLVGALNELEAGGGGSTDIISEASGAIATFNDGGDNIPVKSLVAEITATQAGSGTPSPSNIRSISGFDKVDVYRTNKNFFITEDGTVSGSAITFTMNADGTISASGTISSGNNNKNVGHVVLPAGDYIFSGLPSTLIGATRKCSLALAKYAYSGSADLIGVLNANDGVDGFAFTLTETTDCYLKIYVYAGAGTLPSDTVFKPMIESGSTVTEFVSHKGSIETIILPETIYGGELECVGGSGTATSGYVEFDGSSDESWVMYSVTEGNLFRIQNIGNKIISPTNTKCDRFNPVDSANRANYTLSCASNINMDFINNDCSDVSAWKTFLASNPVHVVFEKQNTTTITTTPESIPTLSGNNNIYADSGDVSVEYFNENADQTSKLIDAKQEYANYSSEEKVVGKWLDGSPLYEKILYFNNKKLDKADNTSELVHGITDIGSVRFVAEVYFQFPNSGQDSWSPANNGLWNNGVYNFYWCVGETSIWILSASGVYFDASSNRSYLVKIRYTKS